MNGGGQIQPFFCLFWNLRIIKYRGGTFPDKNRYIQSKLCYNGYNQSANEVNNLSYIERKVTKIGNSYGITVPTSMLREAGLSYGDNVQLESKDGEIILRKRKDIKLPVGLSPDFFEVLERNTNKHEKTIQDLIDR